MHITVLSGGIGGARFLTGLLHHLDSLPGGRSAHRVTIIANTADDITLHGLRVCPDLDTVMYTLGGGHNDEQGWGRTQETFSVATELAAYDAGVEWFTLGDKDFATHIVRSRMLGLGYPLSQVTAALAARWHLGPEVELLPMSDDGVETHIVVDADDPPADADAAAGAPTAGRRAIHFQEWWVRHHAALPAHQIIAVGIDRARPGPGVLEAIEACDVVILPPSNPVVSIGPILGVPGVRDAVRATAAPVVGLSPIIAGRPVRGMADACLRAIGVETSAHAVGGLFADLLDAWLVDTADGDLDGQHLAGGSGRIQAVPLVMRDVEASAAMAAAALRAAGL